MLKDLDRKRIPITLGGKRLYLRYNLNARRYLEDCLPRFEFIAQVDSDSWLGEEILHLLRAGLMDCYYNENRKAIEARAWDKIRPSMADLGRQVTEDVLQEINGAIMQAFVASLPEAPFVDPAANFPKGGRETPQTGF